MYTNSMDEEYFDFRDVTEENEQLDFDRLISCPHCEKPIPQDATMCLYCGEETTSHKRSIGLAWVAVIVLIVFIIFCLFII